LSKRKQKIKVQPNYRELFEDYNLGIVMRDVTEVKQKRLSPRPSVD
jgi:hypothetical protein